MIILDASALLAYLHQETGWESVQSVIPESCIGTVNWCEVAQKIVQKGMDVGAVRNLLEELGLMIVPFSVEQAEIAAQLWEESRRFGLSLADRACLGLAIEHETRVLTADRVWSALALNIEIQQIR
ncbi:MAG: type II toxin-antitoxin system VapC family toxin [Mariprofundaceae bacterium]|nr:type II toxin-antitoxin system VapC family toxin [Mariprofundaceae bacterium]